MSNNNKSNKSEIPDIPEIRLEEEELRQVTLFAAACARHVLPIFEASHPLDPRSREAITEAESFAEGKPRTAALRASAWAAYTAAREVDDGPAGHAAYAASHAAAAAFLHPIASPRQVKHVLGAAIHQSLAIELGAQNDSGVSSEQIRWTASLATSTVRNVLRRFPPPRRGSGRFSKLLCDLDAELRDTPQ